MIPEQSAQELTTQYFIFYLLENKHNTVTELISMNYEEIVERFKFVTNCAQ